jgi:hypothetical protein
MTLARWSVGVLGLVVASVTPVLAQQPAAAGHVKIVSGDAFVVRGGAAIAAQPGQVVFQNDTLRTGANGAIGITLNDDTRVSLGPSSEMRVDRFVFAPGEGSVAMVLQFMRGVAAYVSGRMAKLAPDAVRLETPAAIVGVRGTTIAIRVEP